MKGYRNKRSTFSVDVIQSTDVIDVELPFQYFLAGFDVLLSQDMIPWDDDLFTISNSLI